MIFTVGEIMIVCPNCGKRNADENKFCGECGSKLPAPKNFCPICNKTYDTGEKFCTNCGQKLVNKEEYDSKKIQEQKDKDYAIKIEKNKEKTLDSLKKIYGIIFCPNCGNELPKIANECDVCGTKLNK